MILLFIAFFIDIKGCVIFFLIIIIAHYALEVNLLDLLPCLKNENGFGQFVYRTVPEASTS